MIDTGSTQRRPERPRATWWRCVTVVGLVVGGLMVGSPAAAEVIDVPPDGEGRITISIDADVAALDRITPQLLVGDLGGADIFDSACVPVSPNGLNTAAFECTGLTQVEHVVAASGAIGDERTSVSCGLPGLYQEFGTAADLAQFPHVQACTIVVGAPGVRIVNFDDAGDLTDPPATVTLFDQSTNESVDAACAVADAGNPPALRCDLDEGEYWIFGPDEAGFDPLGDEVPYPTIICLPGAVPPIDVNGSGRNFTIGAADDETPFLQPGLATCRNNPIPEEPFIPDLIESGTARILLSVIGTPGTLPDIDPSLVIDGIDVFDTACVRRSSSSNAEATTLSYLCQNLERGVYELSAPTLGSDDVSYVSCRTVDVPDPFSTIDLREFPYNATCGLFVEPPHIVINDGLSFEPLESVVLLDEAGTDISDTCRPTTNSGVGLALMCSPLSLGTYTLRAAGAGPDDPPGIYCDGLQPWFSENVVTLAVEPSVVGTSHAPRCDTSEPERITELTVLFENPPVGATVRIDRDGADASAACVEGSLPPTPAAPGETASAYYCQYRLGGTFTPSFSQNPSGIEPAVSCVPTEGNRPAPAATSATITYDSTSWFCLVRLPLRLPETGTSTAPFVALGSFSLLAGIALLGLGSRRRPLRL